jgi:hypothetical protein
VIWIEGRFREVLGDSLWSPWVTLDRLPGGSTQLPFPDLVLGHTYEIQMRQADDETGETTDWAVWAPFTVLPPVDRPAPPTGLRVECNTEIVWEPSTDGMAVAYEIRHAPDNYPHWSDMVPIPGVRWPGPPFPVCNVPKGLRTIAVVAVDAKGSKSDPLYAMFNLGPFDDAEPVVGRETAHAPAFAGIRVNGSLAGALLVADVDASSPADTDDNAPAWQDDDAAAAFPTTYKEMQYVVRDYDPGSLNGGYDLQVDRAVLTIDVGIVAGRNWRVEYRTHDAPAWSPNDLDPAWKADDNSLADHGVDDDSPAWGAATDPADPADDSGPAFDQYAWKPWPGRLARPYPERMDFRIVFPAGPIRAQLSRFTIRETLPDAHPLPGGSATGDLHGPYPAPDVVAGHFNGVRIPLGSAVEGDFLRVVGGKVGGVAISAAYAPAWEKFTFNQGSFHDPGVQKTVNVTPILAGDAIFAVVLKPTIEWQGTGMTAITGCLGVVAIPDKYLPDVDLDVAPGATVFYSTSLLGIERVGSGSDFLVLRLTTDVGPLNNLTAGSVDVWVLRSRMPS